MTPFFCVRGVRDGTPDFPMTLLLPYMQQSIHQQNIPHVLSNPPTATWGLSRLLTA